MTTREWAKQVAKRNVQSFRTSLYQRMKNGQTLVAGEEYIYFNGFGVEAKIATVADIAAVEASRAAMEGTPHA